MVSFPVPKVRDERTYHVAHHAAESVGSNLARSRQIESLD